ncbi:hypothetical protein B9Z55_004934 [Caenorhabditis nigoni]|uniref:ISXO2-like transposase domain-containing protein n=1 Tax=Caenorhabditis nigoni TaxID=1611254 RepID=A0A2G5UYP7_9PELO|nr:hypothetical protein B9Z55_004934 [Caenorhabditis nigoni]
MNLLLHIFVILFLPAASTRNATRLRRAANSIKFLVEPEEVSPIEEILEIEELRLNNLHKYIGSANDRSWEGQLKAYSFLARYGLIANERRCRCNAAAMSVVADGKNLIWRCTSCKGSSKLSLKSGSFFEGLKTSVQSIIYLAASWIENPQKTVRQTALDLQLSPDLVVDAYAWFRDMCQAWFERESANQRFRLGGPGTVVEIDETLLYKAKYNRGRMLNRPQIWVFGLLERGTNKVAMFEVPNRTAATLLPLIEAHVEPGTTVISDGWAAYGGIRNLQAGYNHLWVNHKTNFVDPLDRRVHTQGIESTWGAFKRLRKQRFGDPQESLKGHLFTYTWRRFHNHKKLLNHLLMEMLTYRRDSTGSGQTTNPVFPMLQPRNRPQVHAVPSASLPVNLNALPVYQQVLPIQQVPSYQQVFQQAGPPPPYQSLAFPQQPQQQMQGFPLMHPQQNPGLSQFQLPQYPGPSHSQLPQQNPGPSHSQLPQQNPGPSHSQLPQQNPGPSHSQLPQQNPGPSHSQLPQQNPGPSHSQLPQQNPGPSHSQLPQHNPGPSHSQLPQHNPGPSHSQIPQQNLGPSHSQLPQQNPGPSHSQLPQQNPGPSHSQIPQQNLGPSHSQLPQQNPGPSHSQLPQQNPGPSHSQLPQQQVDQEEDEPEEEEDSPTSPERKRARKTGPTSGSTRRGAVQPASGTGRGAVRGAAQGASRGTTREAGRGAVRGATRGASSGAAQGAAPGTGRGAVRGAVRGAAQGPGTGRGATRAAAGGTRRGAVRGAVRGAAQGPGTGRGATRAAAGGTRRGAVRGAVRGSRPKAARGAAQ